MVFICESSKLEFVFQCGIRNSEFGIVEGVRVSSGHLCHMAEAPTEPVGENSPLPYFIHREKKDFPLFEKLFYKIKTLQRFP